MPTEALARRLEFDYANSVPTHQIKTAKDCANDVRRLTIDVGRNGWMIGDRLKKAKEIIPHGKFEAWLAAECDGYTLRTARRLMKLRETYDSPDKITFSQTAALVLAEEGVPEEAREEARKIAATGVRVTPAVAEKVVSDYAPHGTGSKKSRKKRASVEAAIAKPKRTESVRNHLQPVDDIPDDPAPVVIETTAKTVEPEPTAADVLPELSRLNNRLRKVTQTIDGNPVDGKDLARHVVCVVEALSDAPPKFRLVKAGDAAGQAAELFDLYPRKVGRDKALVAIRNALKRVSFDELREAVCAFAKSPAGNAGEYTPHPATWFGEGRWQDDRKAWERDGGTTGKARYKPGPGETFDPKAKLGSL